MEYLYFGLPMVITLLIGKPFIAYLKKLKYGQEIRKEGPQSHLKKAGTPTMGGILFTLSFVIMLTICLLTTKEADLVKVLFIGFSSLYYGYLGYTDDIQKVIKKDNLGLTAKQKFLAQVVFSVLMILFSRFVLKIDTNVHLPFSDKMIDLGYFYYPIMIIMITGASNGVNLTDGLDGLCAGVSAIVILGLSFLAKRYGQDEVQILSLALSGALIGFLFYNFNPAKVFMGDTGSLFIGGFLASSFMVMKMPFHLIVLGIYYVVETLSVIIQVVSFKLTGKRVFLMSPIHHHFEMKGHKEKNIVLVSYIIVTVVAVLTVIYG